MDTEGNIRELFNNEKPKANEVLIDEVPNPNCKDCYGKGYLRWIIKNIRETKPCHCLKPLIKKETKE